MSDFTSVTHVIAKVQHKCCECGGIIAPLDVYERTAGTWDGLFSLFKVCGHCENARDWLIEETNWPDDIDGDGHQFYFTQLRDHLMEQAKGGDPKFSFRAYRHIVAMKHRRQAYADAYNAETVRIRDRFKEGVS